MIRISTALFLLTSANGFQVPSPLLAKHLSASLMKGPPVLLDQDLSDSSAMLATDGEPSWVAMPLRSNLWIADGGALDVVKNIALGITAVLFLLAGITYLYASFIIPAAAQELEKECKELNPELWAEYQAKLGEGETIATRPDLMQEMGAKLQPLLEAKLREIEKAEEGSGVLPTALETTMDPMASSPPLKVEEEEATVITLTSADQWEDDATPAKK